MESCIFCKIIKGDIPSYQIMETEDFIAFLDIAPSQPGHSLVVPKKHMETMLDMDPKLGAKLIEVLQRVSTALMNACNAEGFNIIQNNYAAAGQTVPHIHWHIIPRKQGDGFALWPQGAALIPEEAKAFVATLQTYL